jgi:hypothetical protein
LTGLTGRDTVSLFYPLSRWQKLAALFVGTGRAGQAARWSFGVSRLEIAAASSDGCDEKFRTAYRQRRTAAAGAISGAAGAIRGQRRPQCCE